MYLCSVYIVKLTMENAAVECGSVDILAMHCERVSELYDC